MLACKIAVFQFKDRKTVNKSVMLDNLFSERYIDIFR